MFRPTRSDSARWIVSIAGIGSSLSYTRNLLDILTKRLRFVALVGSLAVSEGVQTVPSVRNGASKHQRIETFHFADSKLVRQIIGNGPSGPNREVYVKAPKPSDWLNRIVFLRLFETIRQAKYDLHEQGIRNTRRGRNAPFLSMCSKQSDLSDVRMSARCPKASEWPNRSVSVTTSEMVRQAESDSFGQDVRNGANGRIGTCRSRCRKKSDSRNWTLSVKALKLSQHSSWIGLSSCSKPHDTTNLRL